MSKSVFISAEKALKAFDLYDSDDSWLQDYAAEATRGFCQENEVEGDAEYAVQDAIWDKVSSADFEKKLDTIANFIEQSLNHVRKGAVTDTKVVAKGKRAGICVEIGKEFVSAAAEIFGGTGLVGDTYSKALKDVTANSIINAASIAPEVYGIRSFDRLKDSAFDRWEPDTGSWSALKKIADKASRKRRR